MINVSVWGVWGVAIVFLFKSARLQMLLLGFNRVQKLRKILVSVKFVSAILGPEMAAPILWTPGKMRSFCRKTHVHKIPRFRVGFFGGGEVPILFLWARGFF